MRTSDRAIRDVLEDIPCSYRNRMRTLMLKRLWFLLSTLWALTFLIAGATRPVYGILPRDIVIGLLPLVVGWCLAKSARFVVTGSPIKRK